MTDEKTFPWTYHISAALEETQPAEISQCLRKLWAVHHDDYAPEDKLTHEAPPGGNQTTMALIRELRERSVMEAQRELGGMKFR